jgi:CO/xanthine dehydrogenase Mo-binding subunit
MKSGRPAKLVYDRVEEMLATTKRHAAIVRHRTGVKKDGRLTAMDIDVVLDGGAYATYERRRSPGQTTHRLKAGQRVGP